ncbi:hypothetical protein LR68_03779 [Anoxybacillus sp. BCO1]|nr:hypothetical protein LR68_03779 [Anoxybacillus sp. BCO1]
MNDGVLNNFVQIIGITPPSEFPFVGSLNPNNQIAVQEKLTIPSVKPDVEQINTLLIEAVITGTRNIFTPIGVKVVVEGVLRQKLFIQLTSHNNPFIPLTLNNRFVLLSTFRLIFHLGLQLTNFSLLLACLLTIFLLGLCKFLLKTLK